MTLVSRTIENFGLNRDSSQGVAERGTRFDRMTWLHRNPKSLRESATKIGLLRPTSLCLTPETGNRNLIVMSRKRPAESDHFNVGMNLLRLLVKSPRSLGVSEIAEQMGLAVSSTHDMLRVMSELGFIDRNEESRCYRASPQFFQLVHEYANEFGATRKLRDTLDELCQKHRASLYLGTLWGRESIIIAAAGSLGSTYALGASGPAYATAIGRVIISRMPKEEWEEYAPGKGDEPITEQTIKDTDDFVKVLSDSLAKGVAWNVGETGGTVSVAAPIIEASQRCRYGVAFIFSTDNWEAHRANYYAQTIRECAEVLSSRLVR